MIFNVPKEATETESGPHNIHYNDQTPTYQRALFMLIGSTDKCSGGNAKCLEIQVIRP